MVSCSYKASSRPAWVSGDESRKGRERRQEEMTQRHETISLETPQEVPVNIVSVKPKSSFPATCYALHRQNPLYFTAGQARSSPTVNRELFQQPAAFQTMVINTPLWCLGSTAGGTGHVQLTCGLMPTCFSKDLQQVALDIHKEHTG